MMYEHWFVGDFSLIEMDKAYDEAYPLKPSTYRLSTLNHTKLTQLILPHLRFNNSDIADADFRVQTYCGCKVYADSTVPDNCIFME
jgi:hypothetical protein